MISHATSVSIEIADRRLPANMVARRLRRDLPASSRVIGGRLRQRGSIALVVAVTSMLLPRLEGLRIRPSG